jgi:hypothetical protein
MFSRHHRNNFPAFTSWRTSWRIRSIPKTSDFSEAFRPRRF